MTAELLTTVIAAIFEDSSIASQPPATPAVRYVAKKMELWVHPPSLSRGFMRASTAAIRPVGEVVFFQRSQAATAIAKVAISAMHTHGMALCGAFRMGANLHIYLPPIIFAVAVALAVAFVISVCTALPARAKMTAMVMAMMIRVFIFPTSCPY